MVEGDGELGIYGIIKLGNQGDTETRTRGAGKNGATESGKYEKEPVEPEVRKFVNPIKPLMTSAAKQPSTEQNKDESLGKGRMIS